MVRVALTTVLGYVFAIPLPRWLGVPALWGAAGLTASAGIAGWAEMLLLRRTLNRRIGNTGLPSSYLVRLWIAAGSAAAVSWALKVVICRCIFSAINPHAVWRSVPGRCFCPRCRASSAVQPILRRR
jgi:putative peptidoglycan lipid II flippase